MHLTVEVEPADFVPEGLDPGESVPAYALDLHDRIGKQAAARLEGFLSLVVRNLGACGSALWRYSAAACVASIAAPPLSSTPRFGPASDPVATWCSRTARAESD